MTQASSATCGPIEMVEPLVSARPAAAPFTVLGNQAMLAALDMIKSDEEAFQDKFPTWIKDNFHVWTAFVTKADEVWNLGLRRYSARTLIEVIRHHSVTSETFGAFKINNTFCPDISRLYHLLYPARAGFFECRELHQRTTRGPIRRAGRGRRDLDVADTGVLEVGQARLAPTASTPMDF